MKIKALIILIVLLIFALYVYNPKYKNNSESEEKQSIQQETPGIQQEIPDIGAMENSDQLEKGVYINRDFGFLFEFNPETFKLVDNQYPYEATFATGEYKDFMESTYNSVALFVLVRSKDEVDFGYERSGINTFNEVYTTKHTWNPKVIASNVKTYESDGGKYLTFDFSNAEDYQGEHTFSYMLWAKKDDGSAIEVYIMTQKKEHLQAFKSDFDQIVKSFKFI